MGAGFGLQERNEARNAMERRNGATRLRRTRPATLQAQAAQATSCAAPRRAMGTDGAEQLLKLAQALNVSTDDLVGTNGKKKRGSGPTGKMRQLFEAASRLPRSQQQKIAAVLEAFIAHNQGA